MAGGCCVAFTLIGEGVWTVLLRRYDANITLSDGAVWLQVRCVCAGCACVCVTVPVVSCAYVTITAVCVLAVL